jgi:hypothetical protein
VDRPRLNPSAVRGVCEVRQEMSELVRLTDSPVARLNRAVAVGEADGPGAGLAALAELDPALPPTPPPRRTCTSVTVTQ